MWPTDDRIVLAVVAIAAVLAASRAIITARTPQGAIGWVLLIAVMPPVGVLSYLVFGLADLRRTVTARQAAEASPGRRAETRQPADRERIDLLRVFERLSGRQASRGNGVDLLIDGEATYAAFFEAIDAARDYLLVQFYIVRDDDSGKRLREALIRKACEGVRVFVLHDAFYGLGLPRRFVREMEAAGIEIRAPRGPRRILGRFQINFRSHRKLLVSDGRVAFTGGFNIGNEYLGLDPKLGPWRDTHVRIAGPMIWRLQRDFAIDWRRAARRLPPLDLDWQAGTDPRDMCGLILAPGPTGRIETGNNYFCALAQTARRRLWIATPYFVPDTEVFSALKVAALRGIDVRILVPDRPDHYLTHFAAFTYFDEFRQAGGQIWRYRAGFMHQKVALVDDTLASVGTLNVDIRSGLLNFEHTAIVEDRGFARDVERMLEADFARAERVERDLRDYPRWLRAAAVASRLVAPLL